MANINLDFDNIESVMAVIHQSVVIPLDDLLPLLRASYEHARFAHNLDSLPLTLDDCVYNTTTNNGLYKRDNSTPILSVGKCYGVLSGLDESLVVGEITFNSISDISSIIKNTDENMYFAERYVAETTRPMRFLSPVGETSTSYVTDSHVRYDISSAVKISNIIKADREKRLCWELNKEYVLYNFLQEAAVNFITSLQLYRNARSIITSSTSSNLFESKFPGVIDLGIQDILTDECYNILEPLYSHLNMAKIFTWSYYKTTLFGSILTVDRLEDYRIVEWYTTMFEAKELKEYLAKSKEVGFG